MKKANSNIILSIKDASTILTPKAFEKMDNQYISSLHIHVSESFRPGKELYKISRPQPFDTGFAIFPKDGFDLEYLYTMLSSDAAVSMLLSGELTKVKKITVKLLNGLKVAKLDMHQQAAISFLGDMNRDLLRFIFSGDLSPYMEFQQKQISELIDSIYLETLLPDILKEYKINILSNWMQLYENTVEMNKTSSTGELYSAISESLLNPSNPVINNIKKLRVVLDVIYKEISEQS